ncbi:MAG: HAD family hydrolase [Treponema sp.]|jgi:phosphoglycolate phosphatase|nr:HAD family hydrolase [Treponema sp.]
MKYRCVLFDLDGTLVDTIEDIAAAMNRALEYHGFPPLPVERFPGIVGRGIGKLALDALPEEAKTEETAARVAADAARFYAENPLIHSKPYPGMVELAETLAGMRIKTAVISNKPDAITRLVVEGLFPAGAFRAVRGEKPGVPRKPDPAAAWEILADLDSSPREAVLAGDSEVDMETAHNAGCFALGVSWGFRPRRTLEAAGAALIVDTPEEILALIRETRF